MDLDSVILADGTTRELRFGSRADVNGAVGDNIVDNPPSDCTFPATSAYVYFDDPRPAEGEISSFQLTHGDVQSVALSPFTS